MWLGRTKGCDSAVLSASHGHTEKRKKNRYIFIIHPQGDQIQTRGSNGGRGAKFIWIIPKNLQLNTAVFESFSFTRVYLECRIQNRESCPSSYKFEAKGESTL